MSQAQRKFIDGSQYYVNGMQAGSDLGQALDARIELGAVVVADPNGILAAQSTAAADNTDTAGNEIDAAYTVDKMGPWGRNITVVCSGTGTTAVTVKGRDYLGQKITETFALNGITTVQGVKAFKYIDQVSWALLASRTIDVGFGAKFGLPYTTMTIKREFQDGVVASAGTFVAPVYTDPQTATTADPRGLYTPTTTPDGSKYLEMDAEFTNRVNASNNGGLHGIAHYAA